MRPETPPLTVDVIIEIGNGLDRSVVLIERANPPPGWALPGGFVDIGETAAAAARREAREETGLEVTMSDFLGVYSDPRRDPRGQAVSLVFVGWATGTPRAADDARNICLVDPARPPALAFDHDRILSDYVEFRRTGSRPLPE